MIFSLYFVEVFFKKKLPEVFFKKKKTSRPDLDPNYLRQGIKQLR